MEKICNALLMNGMVGFSLSGRAILLAASVSPLSALSPRAHASRQASSFLANVVAGGPALVKPLPKNLTGPAGPTLHPGRGDKWEIAANWKLYSNADKAVLRAAGTKVSLPGFNDATWLPATVPGTVLTMLIDRGIYPDPDFAFNNLPIPESLNKRIRTKDLRRMMPWQSYT